MTKPELVDALAERTGMKKKDAELIPSDEINMAQNIKLSKGLCIPNCFKISQIGFIFGFVPAKIAVMKVSFVNNVNRANYNIKIIFFYNII